MISPSQRSSGSNLHLSATSQRPVHRSLPSDISKFTRIRRKCCFTLLSVAVFLNGILSPAMAGLIAHVLAVTHDQTADNYGGLKRTSSWVVLFSAAWGVIDACLLTLFTIYKDDTPQVNVTGKKESKLRIHKIAALIAVAAVLRSAACAAYANYDYYESDSILAREGAHLNGTNTVYTLETWVCLSNKTVIEDGDPEASPYLCTEARGARYLTILTTLVSGITLLLVLWKWRRRNIEKYSLVRDGESNNSNEMFQRNHLSAAERGRASVAETTPMRDRSSSSFTVPPQEVQNTEIHELPANPIHEMPTQTARDSDELSIQEEYPEYFREDQPHGPRKDHKHQRRNSCDAT